MSRLIARLFTALAISALLVGALALPAAAGPAAPQVRLVDDNGAQCPGAGYTSIQAAINASNTGDKVIVCAGTYVEQVLLNKQITVKSKPLFAAHIVAPGSIAPTNGMIAPVVILNNASLIGFRLDISAGPVVPTVRPTALSCQHVDVGILVFGSNVKVKSNKIASLGDSTLSGACGYDYGIAVMPDLPPGVRPTSVIDPTNVKVSFNWVTDFKVGGILVDGQFTTARIRRNTMRYLHLAETNDGCVAVTTGTCARPNVNGSFVNTFGIGAEGGAKVDVIRNAVYSGRHACVEFAICGPGTTQALNWGIALNDLSGTETTTVFHNSVYRTVGGIVTNEESSDAAISYNRVTKSHYGFQINGEDHNIHHNRATANSIGMLVGGFGSNNDLHDNNASGNMQWDCEDGTTGDQTAGTANTWTNNIGPNDDPDGICSAGDV